MPASQCFGGIVFRKNNFFPLIVKTRTVGAQHTDDSAHSHEVFWASKVTGHKIPFKTFNFLLLLVNVEKNQLTIFKAAFEEVCSKYSCKLRKHRFLSL